MADPQVAGIDDATEESLYDLVPSWELSLRARKLSHKTIEAYTLGVRSFASWCKTEGVTFELTRDLALCYLVESMEEAGLKPSTMDSYLKGVKVFARWCLAEGELTEAGVLTVEPPQLDEVVLPSVTPAEWDAMVATCQRDTLRGKRDEAILGLLRDTGLRARELTGIGIDEVDAREQSILVHGKGGRDRYVGYSDRTALALDRYLRARRKSKYATSSKALLISVSGPQFSYFGLWRMLKSRAEQAGVKVIHPHMFRRMWAHECLDNDMAGGDVKALAGWRSHVMLEHYTKQHANRRALKAQKRIFESRDG